MIVGGVVAVSVAISGLRGSGTIPGTLACLLFVGLGLFSVALAVRERVDIDRDSIRLVRLTSSERIDRDDILYVSQAGGRGRPAGLILSPGVETSSRYLDATTWPVRLRHQTGAATIPTSMRPKRLAQALGVECRPHPTRHGPDHRT